MLSDSSWKVQLASSWNTQTRYRDPGAHLIGFVEEFDARLWPQNWQQANFDDSHWEKAKMIGIPPFAPWNGLTVTRRPHLSRTIVKPIRHWKKTADGHFTLTLTVPAGTTAIVYLPEPNRAPITVGSGSYKLNAHATINGTSSHQKAPPCDPARSFITTSAPA